MITRFPRVSMLLIAPRRRLKSPQMSPWHSAGVMFSTFMIGSSRIGLPFLNPFLPRRDVFPRNDAANDFVLDGKTLATFRGTDVHFHVPILTAAARLLDQLANAMGAAR